MFDIVTVGILLVFIGFGVIFIATVFSRKWSPEKGKAKGGGVVMIGPIPIIFGSDAKWTSIAIVLAILLVLMSLFLTFYVR